MEQMSFIDLLNSPTESNILYIVVLSIVLIFNLALTLVHFVQELKGFQWRYLGAIVGLQIPDKLGFGMFFLGPLVVLSFVGFAGIVKYLPFYGSVSSEVAIACVAAVIGSRLSDSIFIHIRPHQQGYRPNPALGTIPYYLAEAVLLTVLFFPGLRSHYTYAAVGFIGGFALFFSVLPGLIFLRKIKHVEPWQAKTPIPSWVTEGRYETSRKSISSTS